MTQQGVIVGIIIAAFALPAGVARAQDAAPGTPSPSTGEPTPPPAEEPAENDGIGLNLDLGFATAYVFRGLNVFAEDEQLDPHMLLAPGVTWSIFDTGLSVGYWGAYQISGDNLSEKIDAGLGSEQDVILGYALGLPADLTLSFGLTGYIYPWADKAEAGTECPVYVEPLAGLSWAGPLDLSLRVSYIVGLQEEIRDFSYLYVNPRIGRTFALGERVQLALGLGYGFKFWKPGNDGAVNVHDVAIDLALPIAVAGPLYVTPSVHTGWTNLGGSMEFADELYVYGGLNVGVNL
jgi:hypothetical protein